MTISPLNPLAAEKKRQDWASVNTCRNNNAAVPGEIPGEIGVLKGTGTVDRFAPNWRRVYSSFSLEIRSF